MSFGFASSKYPKIFRLVKNGNTEAVKKKIRADTKIKNLIDEDGNSLLQWAVHFQHRDIVMFLIEVGADLNPRGKNQGYTPLLYTVRWGHLDMAKLLLSKGADIHLTDNSGMTALAIAMQRSDQRMAVLLIEKGANLFEHDNKGNLLVVAAHMAGWQQIMSAVMKHVKLTRGTSPPIVGTDTTTTANFSSRSFMRSPDSGMTRDLTGSRGGRLSTLSVPTNDNHQPANQEEKQEEYPAVQDGYITAEFVSEVESVVSPSVESHAHSDRTGGTPTAASVANTADGSKGKGKKWNILKQAVIGNRSGSFVAGEDVKSSNNNVQSSLSSTTDAPLEAGGRHPSHSSATVATKNTLNRNDSSTFEPIPAVRRGHRHGAPSPPLLSRSASSRPKSMDRRFVELGDVLWVHILTKTHDHFEDELEILLENHLTDLSILMNHKNPKGEFPYVYATPAYRRILQKYLFFHRKYRLDNLSSPFEYISQSSMIVLAHKTNPDKEKRTSIVDGKGSGKKDEFRVALKFMKHKHDYDRQMTLVKEAKFDSDFVTSCLFAYDSDENQKFYAEVTRFKFYKYCMVMAAADKNLAAIVMNEPPYCQDKDNVINITRQIILALDHMHSKGYIHGDLNPTNVMRTSGGFVLVDLDSCVRYRDGIDYVGYKCNSFYCPPEMVEQDGKNKQVYYTKARYFSTHEKPGWHISGERSYELLRADPSYDLWSLGATLYFLYTHGQPLFGQSSQQMAVNNPVVQDYSHLSTLYNWSPSTKEEALTRITNEVNRKLCADLLQKDPNSRLPLQQALALPHLVTGSKLSSMYWLVRTVTTEMSRRSSLVPEPQTEGGGGGKDRGGESAAVKALNKGADGDDDDDKNSTDMDVYCAMPSCTIH